MKPLDLLIQQGQELLTRIERLLPKSHTAVDLDSASAWRWIYKNKKGYLEAITHISNFNFSNTLNQDKVKSILLQNTQQFLARLPANNTLLLGPRGTGKLSLIRALLNQYQKQGLKLIELERQHLVDLPEITHQLNQHRGNRSRRIAWQFARYWSGKPLLHASK